MRSAINIVSDNPVEEMWLHLYKWESEKVAERLILEKAKRYSVEISKDKAIRKAQGLAYCLRNARDYLESQEQSWATRLLNTYYGFMSFTEAILIADPTNEFDLSLVERATTEGHGLGNTDDPNDPIGNFPFAQKIHLISYLQTFMEEDVLKEYVMSGKDAKKFASIEDWRFFTFDELMARVPELSSFYNDVTGLAPLSAKVIWDAQLNLYPQASSEDLRSGRISMTDFRLDLETQEKNMALRYGGGFDKKVPYKDGGVWLHFYSESDLSPSELSKKLFGAHIEQKKEDPKRLIVFFPTEDGKHWTQSRPFFNSIITGELTYSKPIFGRNVDDWSLHFCILYLLSIFVRYKPSLWREISEGQHKDYFTLIRYYHRILQRIIPQIALNRITDLSVNVNKVT